MLKAAEFNFSATFLNKAKKEGKIIEITLLDGTTCSGLVNAFDSNTLLFLDPSQSSPIILYKHAIRHLK